MSPPGRIVLIRLSTSFPRVLVLKRDYRDIRFIVSFLAEAYLTVYECVKSMVFTHSYIQTRIVDCTSLADKNVACLYNLITEFLDTESLAV